MEQVPLGSASQGRRNTDGLANFLLFPGQVIVTDASVPPQDESFGQKSASGSSVPCCSKMTIPRRSTGFLWDRTLEDVMEDDDVEMEEERSKSGEETVLKDEENKVLIEKEEYSVSARTALRMCITEAKNNILLFLHLSPVPSEHPFSP